MDRSQEFGKEGKGAIMKPFSRNAVAESRTEERAVYMRWSGGGEEEGGEWNPSQ